MNFGIRSVKNQFLFIRSCYRIYYIKRKKPDIIELFMVGEGGFEPPKLEATDLQSAPFGHSGILPYE